MNSNKKSPAVDVAKDFAASSPDTAIMLPSGVRIQIAPVSAALIEAVSSRVKDPAVPIIFNQDKNRNEEYPLDPAYVAELSDTSRRRAVASMDALYMFGIELIDGLPKDNGWINKLKFLEKHGDLDLSEYDLDDVMDQEFLYKRFIVGSADVIGKITKISGMSPEEVAEAETSFQGNQT